MNASVSATSQPGQTRFVLHILSCFHVTIVCLAVSILNVLVMITNAVLNTGFVVGSIVVPTTGR